MSILIPHAHDIVRVHPGVMADGRNLGGVLLTVKSAEPAELDATESTGAMPIHLLLSEVDLIHRYGGLR